MIILSKEEIQEHLHISDLISALKKAFATNPIVPERQHLKIPQSGGDDATLLLMPAWSRDYIGVKIATVFPGNVTNGKPAVEASYLLKSGLTGELLAILDGSVLTTMRTAAASALASSYLSRANSKTLLVIGAGALAAPLILAHQTIRNFERVLVWNRSKDRIPALKEELESKCEIEIVDDLDRFVGQADVISCATLSKRPLVKGELVKPGCHVDLVGAYLPSMRECDTALIERASVFVDTRQGATAEAGDLIQAENEGSWTMDHIKAELSELCTGLHAGRASEDEITVFKSVGYSLEDLVAAELAYSQFCT
jgi:alanine dehydrogenase